MVNRLTRFLLSALCSGASMAAECQERFILEGIFDTEIYKTNSGSYSLSRNDGDLSPLGRLQLWSALQITSNLQWYAFGEFEADNSSGDWETEGELEQFALRYSSNAAPFYVIEAGKILPPIAMFSERNLSTQNPLIGRPDFLYADYPLGIRLTGSVGWFDYRAALVDKPVFDSDYLPAESDDAYRPDLGIGVTPMQGLRFGLAYTRGPYLSRELDSYLQQPGDWKDYDQRLWAFEFQYSRGYAEFNSEWISASYDIPPHRQNLDVIDYFVELKYTWTPRIYTALRLQRNQYPFIEEHGAGLRSQDVTIHGLELGLGYRFSADTQVKVSVTADDWDVAEIGHDYYGGYNSYGGYGNYPSGRSIAIQFSHHFDVKSWFGNNGFPD